MAEEAKGGQAGGHEGIIVFEGDRLLKRSKSSEIRFWTWLYSDQNTDPLMQQFKQFAPAFYGTEQRGEHTYIILQNLLHGYQHSNVMDCKLGRVTWTPHHQQAKVKSQMEKNAGTTTGSVGFRITGMVVKDENGVSNDNLSKNYFSITAEHLHEEFAKIVTLNGQLQHEVVDHFISETQKLLDWFRRQRCRQFYASSVFYVNGKNGKSQVKYIDFAHALEANGEADENVIEGLVNVINVWQKVRGN